jgi:hypothetical protein
MWHYYSHVIFFWFIDALSPTLAELYLHCLTVTATVDWMVGHNCWDRAYSDGEFWSWMMSQRKNIPWGTFLEEHSLRNSGTLPSILSHSKSVVVQRHILQFGMVDGRRSTRRKAGQLYNTPAANESSAATPPYRGPDPTNIIDSCPRFVSLGNCSCTTYLSGYVKLSHFHTSSYLTCRITEYAFTIFCSILLFMECLTTRDAGRQSLFEYIYIYHLCHSPFLPVSLMLSCCHDLTVGVRTLRTLRTYVRKRY